MAFTILAPLLLAAQAYGQSTSGAISSVLATSGGRAASATATGTSNPPGFTQNPGLPGFAQILSEQPELTMLADLLQDSRFDRLRQNLEENFIRITFLAPSNDALQQYVDTDTGRMFNDNDTFANEVLSYHVINGMLDSDMIPTGGLINSTWSNTLLIPNEESASAVGTSVGATKNDTQATFISGYLLESSVFRPDIVFNQGRIHIINSVLTVPGNLSSVLTAGNFQALAGALEATDISEEDLTSVGSKDSPTYTLFAPTNEAFLAVGSAFEDTSNSSTADALAKVLQYHAVSHSAVFASDLKDGMTIKRSDGNDLAISIRNVDGEERIFVNGARIVAPNLVTKMGVVHGIDEVLNPQVDAKAAQDADMGVGQFPGTSSVASLPGLTTGQPTPTSSIALPVSTDGADAARSAGSYLLAAAAGAAAIAAI